MKSVCLRDQWKALRQEAQGSTDRSVNSSDLVRERERGPATVTGWTAGVWLMMVTISSDGNT